MPFITSLRHAGFFVRQRSGTAMFAMLTLGVGLSAATLMFVVVSTVLLRPLPFGDPDRLVTVWAYLPQLSMGFDAYPIGAMQFGAVREGATAFASMDAFKAAVFNLRTAEGRIERIDGLETTAGLFDTMRVRPAAGRFFLPGEDKTGAARVAVIGYGLWSRMFGRDPGIVGQAVTLNDVQYTVVGVAPPGFDFPRGGEMPGNFQFPARCELWVAARPGGGPSEHAIVARMGPGLTVARAQASLDAVSRALESRMPAGKGWFGMRAVPLDLQTVPPRTRALVRLLFAGAVLLVLVACANAAQLLVVRGLARRREMAARAALGATRATLVGEALAESAVISIGAALVASAGAAAGVRILRIIGPSRFPRLAELAFDWRVAVFALGCALLVTLLTALWPIVSLTRAADGHIAQGSSRGTVGGGHRVRHFVLGVQVAASVLLLIGSGLLVRSLVNRLHADPGFVPSGALTFEMTLPPESYPEQSRGPRPAVRPRIVAAIDQVLERLRSDPRVASAAVGKPLPLSGAQEVTVYVPEGVSLPPASQRPMTEYIVASDQFHDALGARLLFGRDLTPADREASQPVILVTRAFARLAWHQDNVVGRRAKVGGSAASPGPWMTIVGVLDDIKRYDLGEQPLPTMFVPYTQGPYSSLATVPFVVRGRSDDPAALVDAARAAVAAVDPGIPVAAVQPFSALVARASEDARFSVVLMGGFAAAALMLALAGLYGTVAFAVTLRTPELGVRIALGADAPRIVRLVLRDGLWPVASGIVAGLVLAFAGSRLVAALLFGVAPIDPATFALVPVAVLVAAAAACAGPALRAARIDPRMALARNGLAT